MHWKINLNIVIIMNHIKKNTERKRKQQILLSPVSLPPQSIVCVFYMYSDLTHTINEILNKYYMSYERKTIKYHPECFGVIVRYGEIATTRPDVKCNKTADIKQIPHYAQPFSHIE